MTAPTLGAIEARASAATKGPWGTLRAKPSSRLDVRGDVGITAGNSQEGVELPCIGEMWSEKRVNVFDPEQAMANAVFCAEARTDIPWLIARVRELEAQLAATSATPGDAR